MRNLILKNLFALYTVGVGDGVFCLFVISLTIFVLVLSPDSINSFTSVHNNLSDNFRDRIILT